MDLTVFNAIITDSHDVVPFGMSRHPFYYLDNREYVPRITKADFGKKMGIRKLSFLFPTQEKIQSSGILMTLL